jgi:hypothetical protein
VTQLDPQEVQVGSEAQDHTQLSFPSFALQRVQFQGLTSCHPQVHQLIGKCVKGV